MARQKLELNPPVELESRATDIDLSPEQFLQLSLFKGVKQPPPLKKWPGAIRLRRYRRGEVICRQGVTGYTAFSILTSADVAALPVPPSEKAAAPARAATVYLDLARPDAAPS